LPRLVRALLPALVILLPPAATAQEHPHGPQAGERLGRVKFPITCSSTARARFEPAVAYLHSFWYEKAGVAFDQVVAADSTCAMGYWGQAMSRFHLLWTPPPPPDLAFGLAAAERGLTFAPTARERDYLDAIATYYRDYSTLGAKPRLEAYARAMEGTRARHPEDQEAAIFYAVALIAVGQANPTDTTLANQKQALGILEPLFRKNPQHPGLAHYLIHAADSPRLAPLGLYAARRYAEIAPDVPHAQHMPSHVFTLLGKWDDVITSNSRSAASARRFESAEKLDAMWDQRGHALDYLVYAYLQEGRDREARSVVDEIGAATRGFPPNSLINDYAIAAVPARYALERGQWLEATRLTVRPAPFWRATEAITRFARALGGAKSGDTLLARTEVDSLAALEAAISGGGPQPYDWASQVKIQRLAAAAWLARSRGQFTESVRLATEAADLDDVTAKHPVTPGQVAPARELLGDLLLDLNRSVEALQAYRKSLTRAPNRARSLYGAASAAERAGKRADARKYFGQFIALMVHADGERPEVSEAKRYLSAASPTQGTGRPRRE
jgi:tetratricopeptide (TPR) repeat protein